MSLQVIQMLCPTSKYSIKCPYKMSAEYITVHNTASDASAKAEISYMITNNKQTSYHYAVDDYQAVQGLPLDRNGWHAGDGNGPGNRKTIGIEICYSKSGGTRFKLAEQNAAYLIAYLLRERGWGIDRVKKHQDWSGKYCPHRTLDDGWQRFLSMVSAQLNSLQYRVHQQTYGWLPWVSDGEVAGFTGRSKRMESLIIDSADYDFKYSVHQQTYGDSQTYTNGQAAGVTGQSKRIEGVTIDCYKDGKQVPIRYALHLQGTGWTNFVGNGTFCGTKGEKRRAEAIIIKFV